MLVINKFHVFAPPNNLFASTWGGMFNHLGTPALKDESPSKMFLPHIPVIQPNGNIQVIKITLFPLKPQTIEYGWS